MIKVLLIIAIILLVWQSLWIPFAVWKLRKEHKKCKEMENTLRWVVTNCDIKVREDTPDILFTFKPYE